MLDRNREDGFIMYANALQGNPPREFLDALFGRCPPDLYLLIWELIGKRSTWFRIANLDEAAEFAASRTGDTYFGVGLSPEDFGPSNRCEADKTAGIVGLWADIDIKGDAHKAKGLPETFEDAFALTQSLYHPTDNLRPVCPTFCVDSGHGLQVYWLFNEPWIFANDAERQEARQLIERFQGALRQNAEAKKWKLDSTHDLARVLRMPGTINCKRDPVRVYLLEKIGPSKHVRRHYDRHYLADAAPLQEPSTFKLHVYTDHELALSALAALKAARFDPYMDSEGGWLEIGMALHSVDQSASMCDEWDRASRQSDHYEQGVCEKKWKTFAAGGGLSLGSLIHWARADGWIDPRGEKKQREERKEEAPPPLDYGTAARQLVGHLIETFQREPALRIAFKKAIDGDTAPCA